MNRCPICSAAMIRTSIGDACSRPSCPGPTNAPLTLRAVAQWPEDVTHRPQLADVLGVGSERAPAGTPDRRADAPNTTTRETATP
jgi:hypothetical protein